MLTYFSLKRRVRIADVKLEQAMCQILANKRYFTNKWSLPVNQLAICVFNDSMRARGMIVLVKSN